MEIIAICNQKGGVAKTTTTLNLGSCLVELGCKVLLIDLDSQANLTKSIKVKEDISISVHDCLIGHNSLNEAINSTEIDGLDIVISNISLANIEGELAPVDNNELIMKNVFLKSKLNKYDYVLIDCSPALNVLTVNALVAANSVIIPLEPSIFGIEGLAQLVSVLKLIIKNYNMGLYVKGVLLTRVDSRSNIPSQFRSQLKGIFGEKLFDTMIHQNVSIVRSQIAKKPVNDYDKLSKSYREYLDLAKEVISRGKKE